MSDKGLIPPHGGKLVNLIVEEGQRRALAEQAKGMPRIRLPEREQCDLELLAVGALSPQVGFMGEAEFHRVLDEMKLSSGLPWTVPITCSVDRATAERIALETGNAAALGMNCKTFSASFAPRPRTVSITRRTLRGAIGTNRAIARTDSAIVIHLIQPPPRLRPWSPFPWSSGRDRCASARTRPACARPCFR